PLPDGEPLSTLEDQSKNNSPYTIESIEPRSPININTASKPVLYAVFYGLGGFKTVTENVGTAAKGVQPARFRKESVEWKNEAEIKAFIDDLYNRIHGATPKPFRTWEEFWEYLESKVGSLLTRDQAELIFANANPNVRVNKFGPPMAIQPGYFTGSIPNSDYSIGIDKLDLFYYTTEFTFSDMGSFHIESRGYLETKQGVLVATAKIHEDVIIYEAISLSSQRDFESHRTSSSGITSFPFVSSNKNYPSSSMGWLQLDPIPTPAGSQLKLEALFEDSLNATPKGGASCTTITSKTSSASILEGGDLTKEGVVFWQDRTKSLTYSGFTLPTRGSLEFWIKLLTPPQKGSNEVLVLANRKYGTGLTGKTIGITLRLERYGTDLVSTMFIWGDRINSSISSIVWHEVTADISDWQANEWHHIGVSWKNLISQTLFVDGIKATSESILESFTPGVKVTIGGYDIWLEPDRYNKFRLISQDTNFEGIYFGGYSYNAGSGGSLYNINVTISGNVNRFTNAVLDDFRVYGSNSSFVALSRYEANPAGTYDLKIPVPKGATLGTLCWTVQYPKKYKNTTVYSRGGTKEVDVTLSYKNKGIWNTIDNSSTPYEGMGYAFRSLSGQDQIMDQD
ncbi:MAG: hypothetical protein D6785_07970, partial [Planctomycetota bacterium]